LGNLLATIDDVLDPVTDVDTLMNNLKIIMDPLPKKVPILISVDEDVPAKITGDDLTLFRLAMSLLSHAVTRSRSESGKIDLVICPTGDELCFECRDSGAEISPEERAYLFTSEVTVSSKLASFAATVRSMQGGKYGYWLDPGGRSVFWFSVPFTMAEGSYGSVTTSTLSLAAKPSSARPASQLALCGNAMCNTNVFSSA
jgi:signal transduction histidine kinase